ncbi:MAG: Rrf2 family transcriptional regulator [Patescibacteria group bacterium]
MSGVFQVSTRDHSALILMSSLASRFSEDGFVRLADIADEMKLSLGYLEEVAGKLKQSGLIVGKQGPNGGYRLAKTPKEISVDEILTALAGPIKLVDCQSGGCPVAHKCSSKNVWDSLQQTIQKSLKATTLASIV